MIWKLFWEFFKVSCFAFGGAYGAIPLVRDAMLANGWLGDEQLSRMIAVSESTPGPIIVNLATYVGREQAGFWGSLAATVGVVLPAYLVILIIAAVLHHAMEKPWVQAVLGGLKPCVTGVILAMGIYLTANSCFGAGQTEVGGLVITAALWGILAVYARVTGKKLSPLAIIGISAVLGVAVYGI